MGKGAHMMDAEVRLGEVAASEMVSGTPIIKSMVEVHMNNPECAQSAIKEDPTHLKVSLKSLFTCYQLRGTMPCRATTRKRDRNIRKHRVGAYRKDSRRWSEADIPASSPLGLGGFLHSS